MSTTTIATLSVELNAEGFFVHPEQWTEAMASELARRDGIDELTESHWNVIRFMRTEYFAKGTGPTVRMLGKTPASRSRSCTNCSRMARQKSLPALPASRSLAAASEETESTPIRSVMTTIRRSRSSSQRVPSTGSTQA